MIDVRTNRPLRLSRGEGRTAGFDAPVSQLPAIQELFTRHAVNYWLQDIISDSGDGHPVRRVTLSRNENHDRVQELLDSAA